MNTETKEGTSRRDFFKTSATAAAIGAATVTGAGAVVCALAPKPQPIIPSKIGQAVSRVKQAIIPTQAAVRYDASVKMWAVLDKKTLKPLRHFTHGSLTNVSFSSQKTTRHVGCAGSVTEFAGIAEGTLREGQMGTDHVGYRNLKFKDGSFLSFDGGDIQKASMVVLLPDRHAIYKA